MNAWLNPALLFCVGALGCITEPDFGGQEGEEFRGDTADSDYIGPGDSADSGDSGGDGPGTGNSGQWTSWSGTLTVERGLTESPGQVDCVLSYQMQGATSALECDGCLYVFDVQHVIDPAASVDLEACPDAFDAYASTYALRPSEDESGDWQVLVKDSSGSFVALADGIPTDDGLSWVAGEADVPEGSGDDVRYRTELQSADVRLQADSETGR